MVRSRWSHNANNCQGGLCVARDAEYACIFHHLAGVFGICHVCLSSTKLGGVCIKLAVRRDVGARQGAGGREGRGQDRGGARGGEAADELPLCSYGKTLQRIHRDLTQILYSPEELLKALKTGRVQAVWPLTEQALEIVERDDSRDRLNTKLPACAGAAILAMAQCVLAVLAW